MDKSSALEPNSIEIKACWTISAAAGPKTCTPRIVSVFAFDKTLTKPTDWSIARPLPLAENGKLPTLYEISNFFNSRGGIAKTKFLK